jgi:hypothetical protein
MFRGTFAEAARVFVRIMPERKKEIFQLTLDHEKLAASVPKISAGIAILFRPVTGRAPRWWQYRGF